MEKTQTPLQVSRLMFRTLVTDKFMVKEILTVFGAGAIDRMNQVLT